MFTVKLLIQKLRKLYPVSLRILSIYGLFLTLKNRKYKKSFKYIFLKLLLCKDDHLTMHKK